MSYSEPRWEATEEGSFALDWRYEAVTGLPVRLAALTARRLVAPRAVPCSTKEDEGDHRA